jgi:HSP20 family protein
MSNITRFDPFTQLARFNPFRDMEEIFPGLSLRPVFRDLEMEPQIKLDVAEEDKAYTIKAEIPGVKKEDIEVSIDGNQVSISAEVKRETEEKKGTKVIRSERYYGKQYRSFGLAHDIDQAKAAAEYHDGVLQLTLPKKGNGAQVKKIAVQ